ncbi:MAG TPA: response regulator, partial [Euzebyales bacterium]|nr:response regulator [Euzebyales bacterium]
MYVVDSVRLLVVDDEPPIADLVATVARYEGWSAVTANTGEEALRQAEDFHPDIVVLDVMLPDLDGFSVLDRLRETGTMVPVVFLTARDGTGDRIAGLTRGGDDYLVKPFAVEELMARLRAVLRRTARSEPRRASVLEVA